MTGAGTLLKISIDHIVHHLCTIFALGALPETLKEQYKRNASYQQPPVPLDEDVVQDLSDPAKYTKYLGNERYYRDYLVFFQKEMEKKGYEEVINEYMLKGDERADELLVRMYAGMILQTDGL